MKKHHMQYNFNVILRSRLIAQASLLTTVVLSSAIAISVMPASAQVNNRAQPDEVESNNYQALQQSLIAEMRFHKALEVAEQRLSREFFNIWAPHLANSKQSGLEAITQAPNLNAIRRIAQTQKATLVTYSIITNDLLYIWVIKPNGAIVFRSVDLKQSAIPLARLVGQVHRGWQSDANNGQPTVHQQLYQLLVAPIANELPKNPNDLVIFVPDVRLSLIPFAALQMPHGQYLIEQHTISTAPSIQALALTQMQRQNHIQRQNVLAIDKALIVGNPIMPIAEGQQLASLPSTKQEAISIAAMMNAKPLVEGQATKQAILQQMPNSTIIHLASHGFPDVGDSEIPGAIALTPSLGNNGWLTVSDILQLKLNANLVVLSTGTMGRRLPQAFMIAGVPSVIAPLRDANDQVVSSLMIEFHRQLKINPNKAVALRQAMLITMKQHPDPADWAAFTLVGEAE
jgi:CHAT domain-containing protein